MKHSSVKALVVIPQRYNTLQPKVIKTFSPLNFGHKQSLQLLAIFFRYLAIATVAWLPEFFALSQQSAKGLI